MYNNSSISATANAKFSKHFFRPLYESYCFSRIPATIETLFGLKSSYPPLPDDILGAFARRYEKVVLVFLDAFGWVFLERYTKHKPNSFLEKLVSEGVTSKLTAQFPSTTAAHVTTIFSGLPVYESGIYEWLMYHPKVGEIFLPVHFSRPGDGRMNTLAQMDVLPADLYPAQCLHTSLIERGVASNVFQFHEYLASAYNAVTCGKANKIPFDTTKEGLRALSKAVMEGPAKSFYYFYCADIDSVGHGLGPQSKEFDASVAEFFSNFEAEFMAPLQGKVKNTLLLFTADHGQVVMNPATTIYVDQELPKLNEWILRSKNGVALAPAGSSRDLFLHVKPEHCGEALSALMKLLYGKAEVYSIDELISYGFFGSTPPAERFLSNVGNIVVLPYEGESVFWLGEHCLFRQRFLGHHGGATESEMMIPLIALPL